VLLPDPFAPSTAQFSFSCNCQEIRWSTACPFNVTLTSSSRIKIFGVIEEINVRVSNMEGKLESVQEPVPRVAPATDSFPTGLNNAFVFSVFNALSFQIVLTTPMVLYAKSLGASATVLGIITGMTPLLVIFQIPAAQYVHRVGYKRFVFAGWGTRVLFIFAMALVPLTGGFLDAKNRLALMLMLLFCFNLSRGISSCAWLPWITSLVPASIRGKYLAGDAASVNVASFVSFLLAAFCLRSQPQDWQFSVLFAFSAISGATSLVFLKRIPEVPMPEAVAASTTRGASRSTLLPAITLCSVAFPSASRS